MVLTSCRDPRLLEAVARFPVSDYQLKPLAPDRLAGRLRAILAHPKLRFTLAEQNGRLECSIARRTGGRIHDLRVETVDGRVIVHGRSDSHHVKQLALAAVLEAFEASQSQSERVEMDIEVAPIDGWQARRCALSETTNENYSNELALANESLSQRKTSMNVRHVCKWCVVGTLLALGLSFGLNKALFAQPATPAPPAPAERRRPRRVPRKGCKCSRAGRFTRPSRKP